jgi:hypothetical protein
MTMVWAVWVVAIAPAAFIGWTGIGVRYTAAADDHGDPEGEEHAKRIHLENADVGDDKGDESAQVAESAGDLHAIEAIGDWR